MPLFASCLASVMLEIITDFGGCMKVNVLIIILLVFFFGETILISPAAAKSRSELQTLAEKGDKKAQYELAGIWRHGGWSMRQNLSKSFYWYKQSAENGYLKSQYQLYSFYRKGLSTKRKGEIVPKDQTESQKWLRKAANGGHIMSKHILAMQYMNGTDGLKMDVFQGMELLKQIMIAKSDYRLWQLAGKEIRDVQTLKDNDPIPGVDENLTKVANISKCDKLSSNPLDPRTLTKGVEWNALKNHSKKAIIACEQSIMNNPIVSRFYYQLARSIHAKEDGGCSSSFKPTQTAVRKGSDMAKLQLASFYIYSDTKWERYCYTDTNGPSQKRLKGKNRNELYYQQSSELIKSFIKRYGYHEHAYNLMCTSAIRYGRESQDSKYCDDYIKKGGAEALFTLAIAWRHRSKLKATTFMEKAFQQGSLSAANFYRNGGRF